MSYTIEISEPVYKMLSKQADTRNSSLENVLEHLLSIAPFVLPATNVPTEKETLQQEIIQLYSTDLNYQELQSLKQILADFFARKAISEADAIWDEEDLSDQLMDTWLNEA